MRARAADDAPVLLFCEFLLFSILRPREMLNPRSTNGERKKKAGADAIVTRAAFFRLDSDLRRRAFDARDKEVRLAFRPGWRPLLLPIHQTSGLCF